MAQGIRLYWNDADTILRGGHWWLEADDGQRVSLHEIVRCLDDDLAHRCVVAHVDFLAELLAAADDLQRALAEGLGEDASRPAMVDPNSPMGQTCNELAAALDAWVYDLARALRETGAGLGPRAGRLILDAAQVSVYLRSLTGTHRWPTRTSV